MEAKRILIVDDQNFSVKMMRDALAAHGFEVYEAVDGLEACKMATEVEPDLILMDMIMPRLDGIEACRRIKRNKTTAAIPVIIITANKDKDRLVEAFKSGADDYLNKPFASHELLARINSNLMKQQTMNILRQKMLDSELLLEIAQAVTSTLNTREILQTIVSKIATAFHMTRCSITLINENETHGYVLASSDNPEIEGLRIELERYPEIREVLRTGKAVVLEDVKNSPLMEAVRETIFSLDIATIVVLPVIYRSEVIGTLALRTARQKNSFTNRELSFFKLIATVSANALKNANSYEKAREKSIELQEMHEQLKELDKLKSEFISTATHELRIPVTVNYSYCSLIKENGTDNLTAEQLQFLDAAINNSERMIELIDDMLDIAKLDSGKDPLNITKGDIIQPVREVHEIMAPFAAQHGLKFSISTPSGPLVTLFDHLKIRSVLTNLVGNAVKFTPTGGEIGISVAPHSGEVHVTVHDTGAGIPENLLQKIFDEFCQLQQPDSVKRGSGLGLSICKRIISFHNGRMWATSTPREGSRFTFSIPLQVE